MIEVAVDHLTESDLPVMYLGPSLSGYRYGVHTNARFPIALFIAKPIALFFWGRAAILAIQAFEIWKQPYVPGSMRNKAKYRAALFVVAIVMTIPTIATILG